MACGNHGERPHRSACRSEHLSHFELFTSPPSHTLRRVTWPRRAGGSKIQRETGTPIARPRPPMTCGNHGKRAHRSACRSEHLSHFELFTSPPPHTLRRVTWPRRAGGSKIRSETGTPIARPRPPMACGNHGERAHRSACRSEHLFLLWTFRLPAPPT